MNSRFAFVVPLRNPSTTTDWGKTVNICIETLRSLSRNGESPVEIILVCREFPDIEIASNVSIIRYPFPDPDNSWEDLHRDKYTKLKMGFVELRRRNAPFYVMKFDADDLVSDRLAPWVLSHDNQRGYLIEAGYQMDMRSRQIVSVSADFHYRCGSSNILFAKPDDLPMTMDDNKNFDLMRLGHNIVADTFESRGTPLDLVPFAACIYRVGTGQNISLNYSNTTISDPKQPNWKFHVGRALNSATALIRRIRGPRVDERLRTEFCVPE